MNDNDGTEKMRQTGLTRLTFLRAYNIDIDPHRCEDCGEVMEPTVDPALNSVGVWAVCPQCGTPHDGA